ncbi:MAG: hypothetical protein HY423_11955 [Candidatus Lambdaproteobacteria bacterium]|nr:hypothetical protein [Candidatus Lambdaproteobacteria bacterium]
MATVEAGAVPKTREAVLRALKGLYAPLQEFWGDANLFRVAAVPILSRSGMAALADPVKAHTFAEQVYQQVLRIRAAHFRPVTSLPTLDTVYKGVSNAYMNTPLRQGALWLAYRFQQLAVKYLATAEAQAALSRIYTALDQNRERIATELNASPTLTLDALEATLAGVMRDSLGASMTRFNAGALAGLLVERLRELSRQSPDLGIIPGEVTAGAGDARVLAIFTESARTAELNEARARFARLPEDEKMKRFETFKKQLMQNIRDVAPFAPISFEKFCEAVEASLYPYPYPLEWVRSFLKPIHSNAAQSATFDNCMSVASVHQRYQKLREEKSANVVMLELGKAFALSAFKAVQAESTRQFMKELDFAGEFGWPTTVAELKARLAESRPN